jgi:hypothetical protein
MSRSNPITDFDVVTGPPWAFNPRACPVGPPAVLQKPADPVAPIEQRPATSPANGDPDVVRR